MTAEFKNGAYEPGVYVKGEVARRANTPSEAAKYVWDGFVRQDDEAPAKSEEKSDLIETSDADEKPEGEAPKPSEPRTRKPAGGSK